MKKAVLILLFFILCVGECFAHEIQGVVLTQEGSPVEGAVVLHRSSQNKTVTDKRGEFRLNILEGGEIRLEVIHPDYLEVEVLLSSKDVLKRIIIRLVPLIRQREEIVVTAMRYPESSAEVPAAETVISNETLDEEMPPNITEGIQNIPGVSSLGAGGFSVVPNIRGLARRRVLIMVDNARITSDRRTGPNASFVDPKDVEKIEVLRSPSSVFYGSDAIGGVIHVFTKRMNPQDGLKGTVNLKYGTVNREKGLGFSLRGKRRSTGFYLSFQGNDAENYSSPLEEVLMSKFSQGSLIGKVSYTSKKREVDLGFIGSRGYDIGKPSRDSLEKPARYPLESQNLIQLRWVEKGLGKTGQLDLQAYINPHFLETRKEKIDVDENYKKEESYSKTQSVDFGFHLSYGQKVVDELRIKGGLDFLGRAGAKSRNIDTSYDPSGQIQNEFEQFPFSKGGRSDLGFFISGDYTGIKNLDLVAGVRLDFIRLEALPGSAASPNKIRHTAWTGFIGGSVKLTEAVIFFANLSRAYRAPSLNELFYTGITGRGFIIAQPDLSPEMSLNLDTGLKIILKRFFLGLYSFYYEIDNLIERFRTSESIYTYGNVDEGRIYGVEVEMEYYPRPGWKIFGNFFVFEGTSLKTKDPLNDVPPPRLYLGTRFWIKRFSAEVNAVYNLQKADPGPAEIENPSYEIVNLKFNYAVASSLRVYLFVSNLFNKTYLARPDPDSIEEPGRNIVIGLNVSF